jgi:hypothetical protein
MARLESVLDAPRCPVFSVSNHCSRVCSLTLEQWLDFPLSNAVFDAGIAAWDAKIAYDSVRPISAIPLFE